jgi:hypothetical protein
MALDTFEVEHFHRHLNFDSIKAEQFASIDSQLNPYAENTMVRGR